MADSPTPGTPAWWLQKLEQRLNARRATMQLLDDYYSGLHPLPFLTKSHKAKTRDEFRELLEDCRSNFMRLVVDAVEERLRVEGFRLSAESDATADKQSWRIWQANQMDAESQTAFTEALIKSVSYLSVWAGDPFPQIAVEDPMQTIVAYAPGSGYRRRSAALKIWQDELLGVRRANVYLPDAIHKFSRRAETEAGTSVVGAPSGAWEAIDGPDGLVPNPLKIVPIVPLRNRPRLRLEGESELSDLTDTQDRINGTLFLRCLAGYMGAHRQRWAVGLSIEVDPKTGEPVEPFDVDVGKLWAVKGGKDPDKVRFGEFGQTDLGGYIKSIEQDVSHIAITSRTPKHYLLPTGQEPSGDSLKSAESGLVRKAWRKTRPFGEGLEDAIRLARRFDGEADAPVDSEIIWADPQTRTEAEITDAVIKQHQQGLIPQETALEKLGYSQTEINRIMSQQAGRALDALLNQPPPSDGPPAPQPQPQPQPQPPSV